MVISLIKSEITLFKLKVMNKLYLKTKIMNKSCRIYYACLLNIFTV